MNRWAVVTDHPNRQARRLFVHGWYATADEADDASVQLVTATSRDGVISPSLAGLAIVPEHQLVKVGPDEYSWLTLPPELRDC